MNITEFLEARIAEDEADLEATPSAAKQLDDFDFGGTDDYLRFTMGYGRAVAECAAKRALSNLHSPGDYRGQATCNECGDWWDGSPVDYPCPTIKIVAAIYRDHPDYQEAWG